MWVLRAVCMDAYEKLYAYSSLICIQLHVVTRSYTAVLKDNCAYTLM